MTKHFIMTLAAAMAATTAVSAAVITPQQAMRRAQSATTAMAPAAASATSANTTLLATGSTSSNEAAYYVFASPASAQGYVILSADDAAMPVLGYSANGVFDPKNENLAYWLGEYARQIEYGRNRGARAGDAARVNRPWRDPIAPLCKTTWGQDAPYNELCPTDDGVKCPSGCVATAMAQVMKYHNWPVKGTGTHSYKWQGQELTFDYGNTTFNWGSMLDNYPTTKPIVYRKAVYTLMYACGVGVDMNYTSNYSGATGPAVPAAMKAYFDYDKGLDMYNRDYYPLLQWEQMIYDDLKNVGPVYYNGSGDGGGHAFVCDGYDKDGYFHFNWGWDGMSDGYYLLWALDPTAQGTGGSSVSGQGFNAGQQIVLGARKPQDGSVAAPARLGFKIAMQVEAKTSGDAPVYTIKEQPVNTAYNAGTFTLGIRIEGNGVNTVVATSNPAFTLNGGAGINMRNDYNFNLPSGLGNGEYTVTPVYQVGDGQWKDVLFKVGLPTHAFLKVANGEYTASVPSQGYISIQDVQMTSTLYPGNAFSIKANAVNNSGTEQFLGLRAVIAYKNGNKYQTIGTSNLYTIDVPDGESLAFDMVSTLQSGTLAYDRDYYVYFVSTSDLSYRLSEPVKVHVPAQAEGLTLKVDPFNIKGEDTAIDPADCQITGTFNCSVGYFAKTVYLVFYSNSTGTGISRYYDMGYFFADAGQSLPFQQTLSLSAMNTSKTYYLALGYISTASNSMVRISDLKTVKFAEYQSGVNDLDADGATAFETARYDLSGRVLTAPAPGLNIVRYSDGSVRKELVR